MRINIFLENYHKGGLDTFLKNLIANWQKSEDTFHIICNFNHPGLEELHNLRSDKVTFEMYDFLLTGDFLQRESLLDGTPNRLKRIVRSFIFRVLTYPFLASWYFLRLRKLYLPKKNERLLIVNGGYPASLLGRLSVISWRTLGKSNRAILAIHGVPRYVGGTNFIWERFIDFLVHLWCQNIVCVSNSVYFNLKTRWPFSSSKRIRVIPNGIGDPLSTLLIREVNPFPFEYCLMLGTFQDGKGHLFLIRAFAKISELIPEINLVILGSGTRHQKNLLLEEISRMNLASKVHLIEFVSQPFNYIYFSKAVLVPSQEPEAFGLVAIEAMALSKPLITTDAGALQHLVSNDVGLTSPVGNLDDFIANSVTVLNDTNLALKLGMGGRQKFVEEYMASRMCALYATLFDSE